MPRLSARHDALMRKAIEAHHGRVVKTTGDGFHAVFEDASDGVAELSGALDKLDEALGEQERNRLMANGALLELDGAVEFALGNRPLT